MLGLPEVLDRATKTLMARYDDCKECGGKLIEEK